MTTLALFRLHELDFRDHVLQTLSRAALFSLTQNREKPPRMRATSPLL